MALATAKLIAAYHAAKKAWEASYHVAEYYLRWRARRAAKRLRESGQAGDVARGGGESGANQSGGRCE